MEECLFFYLQQQNNGTELIVFLQHREIDKLKWDACIGNANNSFIYGYSWYLDIVSPGWNALVLNDYDAVMPLPTAKKIFTVAYQPFFAQQLGIFHQKTMDVFHITDFIDKIPAEYKYINICLNENNGSGHPSTSEKTNYILYLHQSYEDTFKIFSDHCKRNIKRAGKEGLTMQPCAPSEVVDFYIAHKGKNTTNIKPAHYEVLRRVLQETGNKNMLRCCKVVNSDGHTLACAAFYLQPNRLIYQIGTASEEGRDKRALYFLFSEMIREYCNRDMMLDFEGSQIQSIARFFSGFGSLCMPYYRLVINRLPWPFSWLKN
jgi:hypothetical protein